MFHYAKSILQTTIEEVGLSLSTAKLALLSIFTTRKIYNEDGCCKIVFLETIWLYHSFNSYLDII